MFHLKKCSGCSKDLTMGSTKYNVRIEVTSDFDGFMPEFDEDESTAMGELFDQIESMSEEELESGIHMEIEMILCPECKDRFVEEMENYSEGGLSSKPKHSINLQ